MQMGTEKGQWKGTQRKDTDMKNELRPQRKQRKLSLHRPNNDFCIA
jgi:hypothetical protein